MIRVALLSGPVTRNLGAPYHNVSVTLRRLRTPEWETARERALAIVQDDGELAKLLSNRDLFPDDSVGELLRLKDRDPAEYLFRVSGLSLWLTAVECALIGVISWSGVVMEDGAPAPLTREVLQVLLLDDALERQLMSVLTEASRLLVVEGKPSGASPNGSSEPDQTASAPTTATTAAS